MKTCWQLLTKQFLFSTAISAPIKSPLAYIPLGIKSLLKLWATGILLFFKSNGCSYPFSERKNVKTLSKLTSREIEGAPGRFSCWNRGENVFEKTATRCFGLYFGYRRARWFFSSAVYSKIIFFTISHDFLFKGKIISENANWVLARESNLVA